MINLPEIGYTPSDEDRASLEAWFAEYDEVSARRDVERMTDMAAFPINLVSDDSNGDGRTAQWDRARLLEGMGHAMSEAGEGELSVESVRTPVFLSPSIAVVFSDSTMAVDGEKRQLRYVDILVRQQGKWAYQTMIQPGWGDVMG
ncbi:nuclear transport factor 2 family protein [Streptomyces sp. NPDC003077]|uniref:nuclear transport factor 2 family protein n=1 Tax=Streptomyces sp. NPDC003077 TaxID=3154443 RepID=UPI0033A14E6D